MQELIREKQAHYALALKENDRRFHRKVQRFFESAEAVDFTGMVKQKHDTQQVVHFLIECARPEVEILGVTFKATLSFGCYTDPTYQPYWGTCNAFICARARL